MNYEVIPVQSGTVDSAWGVECGLWDSAHLAEWDGWFFLHICQELSQLSQSWGEMTGEWSIAGKFSPRQVNCHKRMEKG